jgi:C4-dicarboxylate-specific signal transduction histidine kinase
MNEPAIEHGKNLSIRPVHMTSERATVSTVTILVIDRKESMVIEKIDDSKEDFIDAIGSATFSNSEPTVLSYVSIFESLWNQSDLYEQLKLHDKMQEEFINIAAHELRIESKQFKLMKERVDLNVLIMNSIKDTTNRIMKSMNVKILYEQSKHNNIFVEADRRRLQQVMYNLLNNAIKLECLLVTKV